MSSFYDSLCTCLYVVYTTHYFNRVSFLGGNGEGKCPLKETLLVM